MTTHITDEQLAQWSNAFRQTVGMDESDEAIDGLVFPSYQDFPVLITEVRAQRVELDAIRSKAGGGA